MGNQHLKRHVAPKSWPIKRKNITFIAKPNPGSHSSKYVVPLVVLLRDVLQCGETAKEVKLIVNNKEVLVNGKQVKDVKFPIGMFDVVEIKESSDKFVVLFDSFGKIKLVDSKDDLIYLKLAGKKQISKDKFQLNFMNGFNIIVSEKEAKKAKVEDTVIFDFVKKKVVEVLTLKEGAFVYFFDGKFKGQFGEVKEFVAYNGLSKDVANVQIGKEVHNTAKDYAYVVGAKKADLKRFE